MVYNSIQHAFGKVLLTGAVCWASGSGYNLLLVDRSRDRKVRWVLSHAGFHTNAIVALSVATRRTLLATASRDNTVRVWDYHAQVCIAMYQAASPVMGVGLHPWGTDIIISFHESAFTYVVGGSELIKGQRLAESASGKALSTLCCPCQFWI